MAITSDQHDILDVFLIVNLPTIAQNGLLVSAPLGVQPFIDTVTVDNVNRIDFPADLRELLENYILTRRLINRLNFSFINPFPATSRATTPSRSIFSTPSTF